MQLDNNRLNEIMGECVTLFINEKLSPKQMFDISGNLMTAIVLGSEEILNEQILKKELDLVLKKYQEMYKEKKKAMS